MEILKYLSQIFIIFGTIFSLIMWINWHVKGVVDKHCKQDVVNWGIVLSIFLTIGYVIFKL